jgi:hypothetical protein
MYYEETSDIESTTEKELQRIEIPSGEAIRAINAQLRGKPTDLFESFQLLGAKDKVLQTVTGHTCGDYEKFELQEGEEIVGMYAATTISGILKGLGFIVWVPPNFI